MNLQRGGGIASRRGNRADDLLEQRLERRRVVADFAMRYAGFRVGIDDGKIELVFGRVEINEEIVDRIEHFRGSCVRPVNFIEHHDRREFCGQRFLQDVTGLRQRAFARIN